MPTKTDDTWTLATAEVLWSSKGGDFQSLAYATAGKAASAMLAVGSTTLRSCSAGHGPVRHVRCRRHVPHRPGTDSPEGDLPGVDPLPCP